MMIINPFYLLIILSLTLHGDSNNGGFTEDHANHEKEKYNKKYNDPWSTYKLLIEDAVKNYKPCHVEDCYLLQRRSDFRYWVNNGGIKETDFLHARDYKLGTHYQIINHTLYREEKCTFPARCEGNEYFISKLLSQLPDMEFIVNTFDWSKVQKHGRNSPVFSFSKSKTDRDILYPAWTFWKGGPAITTYPTGIGRWDLQIEKLNKAEKEFPWKKKEDIGFFRGSRTSSERDPLILLSRELPSLIDAAYTKNQAWRSEKDTLNQPPAAEVSFEEHCKYKYLFNFRGVAASFRYKHLFLCKSLVFHVGDDWVEFFYGAMKPWVHFIPVSSNLADARDLLDFVKENDNIAQEVAERGYLFIKEHLRMADIQSYWLKILKRYSNLMKWAPKMNETLNRIG